MFATSESCPTVVEFKEYDPSDNVPTTLVVPFTSRVYAGVAVLIPAVCITLSVAAVMFVKLPYVAVCELPVSVEIAPKLNESELPVTVDTVAVCITLSVEAVMFVKLPYVAVCELPVSVAIAPKLNESELPVTVDTVAVCKILRLPVRVADPPNNEVIVAIVAVSVPMVS